MYILIVANVVFVLMLILMSVAFFKRRVLEDVVMKPLPVLSNLSTQELSDKTLDIIQEILLERGDIGIDEELVRIHQLFRYLPKYLKDAGYAEKSAAVLSRLNCNHIIIITDRYSNYTRYALEYPGALFIIISRQGIEVLDAEDYLALKTEYKYKGCQRVIMRDGSAMDRALAHYEEMYQILDIPFMGLRPPKFDEPTNYDTFRRGYSFYTYAGNETSVWKEAKHLSDAYRLKQAFASKDAHTLWTEEEVQNNFKVLDIIEHNEELFELYVREDLYYSNISKTYKILDKAVYGEIPGKKYRGYTILECSFDELDKERIIIDINPDWV